MVVKTKEIDEIKELEKLLLSEDFEQLNSMYCDFNIFNALKLQNNEIRHSNFLGWLMAPYETHGLKDYFLKEFLKNAIKDFSQDENTKTCLSDIIFYNLEDVEIRREYKNIDILILSPINKFLCVIENKIWTGTHDNQLFRYAQIVSDEFANYKKMFIYLSPDKYCNELIEVIDEKNSSKDKYYYIPMNYENIKNVLEKTLKYNSKTLDNEIRIFIEHYKKMLERNIMGTADEKVIALCKKIYSEHKYAIDLINENNNYKTELFDILQEVLKERADIDIITTEGNNSILTLPNAMEHKEKLKFAKWKNYDYIVSLHFVNFCFGCKHIYAEVLIGPVEESNMEKREQFKDYLSKSLGLAFKGKNDWAYTQQEVIINLEEYYKCEDKAAIKNLITERLNVLKAIYIDGLRESLNKFLPK